jgi:hypothetical protein
MIKRYGEFINESNGNDGIPNVYKMLIMYLVGKLNKETDFIGGEEIKESDISYDLDTSDGDKKWYYCTILSERFHTGPFDDDVDDHIGMLKATVKGFDALYNMLEEINTKHNLFMNSMISDYKSDDKIAIKFTVPSQELESNKESLENFFKSTKGIDKYQL